MKRKKLLIDLSILKNMNCGLGQIALNYAKYFEKTYSIENSQYDLYLLLPRSMKGKFGDQVKYVTSGWWKNFLPLFIPRVDVWHSIHQLSKFRPAFKSTKLILTIHDLNFIYEKKGRKKEKKLRKLQRKFDRADIITCISNFTKSDICSHINVGIKQLEVIYNGVEDMTHQPEKKPDFIVNEKPFFFTLGQIKFKKNFHVLLPLMSLYPDIDLYIVGQDNTNYAEEMRTKILETPYKNVHLTGSVSNEERVWMYKNCKAFLFPSLFEGFGLPVIEAMAFGKPVFTSKETSLKEIGGDRAFFWDNFETLHMKEIIDRYLPEFYSSDENKQKNSEYARNFTYHLHLKKYLAIYEEQLFS